LYLSALKIRIDHRNELEMADSPLISGVQQIGIGCKDVDATWKWYRRMLGFDVALFDDSAEAKYMTRYTGGEVHSRRALLALNMSGGGGLEIWQFKSRTPSDLPFDPVPGDIGIYAVKFKSAYVERTHAWLQKNGAGEVSALSELPGGMGFWGKDPFGNTFQIVEDDSWFKSDARPAGGVLGAVIGVSDMDASISFYKTLLGEVEVRYDETGTFDDLPAGVSKQRFRRVLLMKKETAHGAFSHLLGNIQLELLQSVDSQPRTIFKNRFWGDCGFIHLCFDTIDMNTLQLKLEKHQYPFTIDSGESFGMESAAGRFAYVEDPDGTLIELVETHKLPILKKIGWYLDLKKRKHQRPLPNWMLGLMGLGRVKD
jgi:catechol 2,3-dioxygenase-like lactoylglutathione lyase family enzyme